MTTNIRFALVLALAAGCSKSGSSQPAEQAAAKPTAAASGVQARSAPVPAAAPVAPSAPQGPGGPAAPPAPRPVTRGTEGARALLAKLADGKVEAGMFDPMTTVAYVDYSASPRTGSRRKTEKGYCPMEAGIDAFVGELRKVMKPMSGQIAQALADDELACEHHGAERIRCTVGALGDGESTLTFDVLKAGGFLVGISRHETFMIQDDAAVAKDEGRRDRAFTRLNAVDCGLEPTRDDETVRQHLELEAADEL